MRRTDFWERLESVLEPKYAQSWAQDTVLPDIGLSAVAAFTAGVETQVVWHAVCQVLDVPSTLR